MAGRSILVATGFVRIDADTRPALKAFQAIGSIGANALTTALLPAAAAATTAVTAIGGAAAAAGVALGAFGAAAVPQFKKITEASEQYEKVQESSAKADIAKAHAQKIAKEFGVKYGQSIKITSDMSEEAREKAKQYNKALTESQTATNAARKAQELYKFKMAEMTPATRDTAKAFLGLKDDFERWSDSLSGSTMPIFTRAIEALRAALPKLTPFVRTASTEIKSFVDTLGDGAAGQIFREFGENVKSGAGGALRSFLSFGKNMVAGILGILNAFAPMQAGVTGGLADMGEKFAAWSAGLGESQGLQTFLQTAKDAGPRLSEAFGSVAEAFGKISDAAGPLAGVGLTVLTVFANIIDAIPTPVLQLLVPAILAVNTALKLYAIYQAAATAVTWLFTTSVTTNTGVVYANRAVLVIHRITLVASAIATRAAALATAAFSLALRIARGVMIAFRYALVAIRLAVVLTTTAFRLLAIAMISNPIGLVIAGIALLVGAFILAYKKSETFRNIVHKTLDGVKNIAAAVGRWFAGPFVDFFKAAWDLYYKFLVKPFLWFYTEAVPNAAKFVWGIIVQYWNLITGAAKMAWGMYYKFIVKPVLWFYLEAVPNAAKFLWGKIVEYWNLIVNGVKAAWDLYYKLIVRPVLWFYTEAVPNAAKFLWGKIVDYWNKIVTGVTGAFNAIKRYVFSPIGRFFTSTIPGWARTVRDRVAETWAGLRERLVGVYGGIKSRVFNPIRTFFVETIPGWARKMKDKVVDFFSDMKDGLGKAWDGIKSKTKTPINWVIRNVWNNGIRSAWGKITGWIGIKNKLGTIKELAAGGTVGRSGIGIFNRPTAIVGEGNPNYPEYVIPTDPKYATRARGLWEAAGAHFYEDGGILGDLGNAAKKVGGAVSGAAKGVADFFSDPVGKAKKLLLSSLDGMGKLGSSPWVKMVTKLPRMAVDALVDAVKDSAGDLLGDIGSAIGLGPSGGSGVKRWSGVVQMILRQVGQPASYLGITLRRMQQESGGNPTIVNKWDSNWLAGYPSVGLMQVIRPTFQSYAGRYRKTGPFSYGVSVNPAANIYASMKYALAAYGSLPRAYNRPGGYANGTGGSAGGWHLFGENGPELGFSPSGWRILNARRTAGLVGGGGLHVDKLVIENHGVIGSRQETEDWLVSSLVTLKRKGRMP